MSPRILAGCVLVVVTSTIGCSGPGTDTADDVDVGAGTHPACAASDVTPEPVDGEVVTFGDTEEMPEIRWSTAVGTVDPGADEIDGIDVDDRGDVVASGVFRESFDIGDEVWESRGEGDIFVASWDAAGSVRWVRHFGGPGDDNTYDLKMDAHGNTYLSGWFAGTVDFGGDEVTADGPQGAFVAKLDPDGDTVWVRTFGGPGGAGANEIAVSADGEIALSLMTAGKLVVDDETFPYGGGPRDAFVLRMTPDGDVVWVHHFAGTGADRIRAVAMHEDGSVAVGFQYRGTLRSGDTAVPSVGDWDGALALLDPDGTLEWVLPVGGAGEDNVRGVGFAPAGGIYASGLLTGSAFVLDRDVTAEDGADDAGGEDYVAKVTPGGEVLWLVTLKGPGRGVGGELQANARGVITSAVADPPVRVRRDGEILAELTTPSGLPTSYALGLDPDGDLRFVFTATTEAPDGGAFGDVLGVSPDGELLVQRAGFRGTISAAGQAHTTPGSNDSAVFFVCLHGT